MNKLPQSFFTRPGTANIAKELLGKVLISRISGKITSGIIVETEAYLGAGDRACHAFENRRTPRTEIMFHQGGCSYVYLCYGIHHLFNIVTHKENFPHAILIRALQPNGGIPEMMKRRRKSKMDFSLCSGPGSMSEAMGIKTHHSGMDLTSDTLWVENSDEIHVSQIQSSARVGVGYAGEDAMLPLRVRIAGNPWVSKAK